ncbi:MAG: hypothetical protein DI598_03505 [Pseudopedobacter saltans]|uniref:Sulfatase N-terminal domain-containing protein n=1 Tax=Pseudopedobacter saltans TaxID=151895 RepID=A0A2W5F5G2_9SPHI|nr:MAG: hypothetical protein DI598_03505 [Pseudopedobacter saltans]
MGNYFWLLLLLIVVFAWSSWQICKRLLPNKLSLKQLSLIFTIGCIVVFVSGYYNTKNVEGGYWYYGFKKLQPINYPWTLIYQLRERRRVVGFDRVRASYSFSMKKTDSSSKRKVVLLVIGETSRSDHWSLYGYTRKTNPNLAKERNLYMFNNMTAPAGMTVLSFPLIMTGVEPYNWIEHYSRKGIIDAFKEAGFYTGYITNQDESLLNAYKKRDMHYENVDSFYSAAEYFDTGFYSKVSYDERLFPAIKNMFSVNKSKNLFLVIHLNGSHWYYKDRYPKDFDVFKEDSRGGQKNKNGYDKEIAAYDNSILYTDFILHQIIDSLKSMNGDVAMIYTSDHGENLMDDDRKLRFHSPDPTSFTLKIPYFIWINDSLSKGNPHFDSLMLAHKDVPLLASEVTLYTAFDLIGLESKRLSRQQKNNSILSYNLKYSEQPFYSPLRSDLKYKDLLKN